MLQLELQLSGFDLPKIIEHFETKESMHRWYLSEIVNTLLKITADQMIIDHFILHHRRLWYREEIIEELKILA